MADNSLDRECIHKCLCRSMIYIVRTLPSDTTSCGIVQDNASGGREGEEAAEITTSVNIYHVK
jgi:hypothetical protein